MPQDTRIALFLMRELDAAPSISLCRGYSSGRTRLAVITTKASHRSFGCHQEFESMVIPMDQIEHDNWKTIAESMEAKGDTESWFYLRARAIADGKPDPMPNISELMADPA